MPDISEYFKPLQTINTEVLSLIIAATAVCAQFLYSSQ